MLKIHEFFLTFFYFGKAPKAPGTVGSFVTVLFWLCFTTLFCGFGVSLLAQNIFWASFLVISFAYGCFASETYSKQFNQIDHQSIVLDEVVGQALALQLSFIAIHQNYFLEPKLIFLHLLLCFALFRFFDIKKPSFIGYADRNFKNGFGVMFDDLLSGIIAGIICILALLIF